MGLKPAKRSTKIRRILFTDVFERGCLKIDKTKTTSYCSNITFHKIG